MKPFTTLLFLCIAAQPIVAQNECATALPINIGTYTVDQVNGTDVPFPYCAQNGSGATHGEWYSYTAAADTSITVTTDLVQNATRDTRVHVYTGACGTLVCVAGDDDSGSGLLSVATFDATSGTTYIIAFDDRWNSLGFDFELKISGTPPPPVGGFITQTYDAYGLQDCVVDMNSDGLDDIVSVTQNNIRIGFQQAGGTFAITNFPTTFADNTPNWSICAGDLDANGYNDLVYAGGSGTTLMLANADGTAYTELSQTEFIFCQRSNVVDINNDGNLDVFVCHDIDPNVYYLNDGMGGFVWNQGGLGNTPDGGNYGSIWVDYDNDHDVDMWISKCRGGNSIAAIDQMHRNNGDGSFTEVAASLGLAEVAGQTPYHQSWSAAWGDYDNDGDMDVLIGTSTLFEGGPSKLMRNDGSIFADVTSGSGFDISETTSNEWVTHDFNNDGFLDILGGGVYFEGHGDFTFTEMNIPVSNGPVGDLNNDGFLDVQNNGVLYMNEGNDNHWLTIHTIGTVSNVNGIGARVEVTSPLGTQIRDVRSGDGFRNMSTLMIHFGLGPDTTVETVTVYWPSGMVDVIQAPAIDGTLDIVEGGTLTGVHELANGRLSVFPVPVRDVLHVRTEGADAKGAVIITDAAGRLLMRTTLQSGGVDVSALTSGIYTLQVRIQGNIQHAKFIKD